MSRFPRFNRSAFTRLYIQTLTRIASIPNGTSALVLSCVTSGVVASVVTAGMMTYDERHHHPLVRRKETEQQRDIPIQREKERPKPITTTPLTLSTALHSTSPPTATTITSTSTPTPLSTSQSEFLAHIQPYGIPMTLCTHTSYTSLLDHITHHSIHIRSNYILQYNNVTRCADWVMQRIVKENEEEGKTRRPPRSSCTFHRSSTIPSIWSTHPSDYTHHGYDRGHLIPAADGIDICQTFEMNNIVPQDQNLNRGYWKQLEQRLRDMAPAFDELIVITGPLFLPSSSDDEWYMSYPIIMNTKHQRSISVPTHFYKIVCAKQHTETSSYLMSAVIIPNRDIPLSIPLSTFTVSLSTIERASGYMFFSHLLREPNVRINSSALLLQ